MHDIAEDKCYLNGLIKFVDSLSNALLKLEKKIKKLLDKREKGYIIVEVVKGVGSSVFVFVIATPSEEPNFQGIISSMKHWQENLVRTDTRQERIVTKPYCLPNPMFADWET